MTTATRQGQARVPGRRKHRHNVMLTDEQEAQIQALAAERGVTVARLLATAALGEPRLNQRVILRELDGIRRMLVTEMTDLYRIARAAESGEWDEAIWREAVAGISARNKQLAARYSATAVVL